MINIRLNALMFALACMGLCPISEARLADKLARLKGYVIAGSKTIVGYADKDGKKSDEFEGCDFDRRIMFDDGTALTCSSYGYIYAYRPTAVILMKSTQYQGQTFAFVKIIVEDEIYEMEPIMVR